MPNILEIFENETGENNQPKPAIINENFTRPAQKGKTSLDHLFPEIKLEHRNIDERFKVLIMDTLGENFSDEAKEYVLFEVQQKVERKTVTAFDGMIIKGLPVSRISTAVEIRANIEYLATDEGRKLLVIPEGEKEVRFILGYIVEGGRVFAVYMEYEFEHGTHYELDFHLSPLDRHRHHEPKGFAPKEK